MIPWRAQRHEERMRTDRAVVVKRKVLIILGGGISIFQGICSYQLVWHVLEDPTAQQRGAHTGLAGERE